MSVFLKFSGKTFALSTAKSINEELTSFFQKLKIDCSELSFSCNGKVLDQGDIQRNDTIMVTIPLLGGKGGFGAKLKNQGGKKVRPNDNKFSRDAHGRRIEYQMAQKQYTQFVKKRMQEDQKVNQQRQKYKVMQQTLKQGHSFMKMDKRYNQEVEQAQVKLTQSIKIGKLKNIEKRLALSNLGSKEQQDEAYKRQTQSQQQKRQDLPNRQQRKQDEQIQLLEKPIKKTKLEKSVQQEKNVQTPVILSAKDKLRSLFKKSC